MSFANIPWLFAFANMMLYFRPPPPPTALKVAGQQHIKEMCCRIPVLAWMNETWDRWPGSYRSPEWQEKRGITGAKIKDSRQVMETWLEATGEMMESKETSSLWWMEISSVGTWYPSFLPWCGSDVYSLSHQKGSANVSFLWPSY